MERGPQAAAGDPFLLGQSNSLSNAATTSVSAGTPGSTLAASNSGTGTAVFGAATNGLGGEFRGNSGLDVYTSDLSDFNRIPGVGIRGRGSVTGIFGEMGAGKKNGPGVWGNALVGLNNLEATAKDAFTGVLGTSTKIGTVVRPAMP